METAKLHRKALDKIGYAIGCERKTCESDDDYRKRIDAVYRRLLIPHDHEELDALMIPLSISEHQLHAFVKWLDKESERKWSTRDANIEIANQTNLWKKYNIDKSFDTPPSEEYCQAMWGVSSIEELHARAQKRQ